MANLKTTALTDAVKAHRTASLAYPTRLANSIAPGQHIHTASGAAYKVVAKTSSAQGVRLRISRNGKERTINVRQLAALYPASPAVLKFAAAFIRIALDQNLNAYVNEAIKMAGLPIDPSMNWAKWLTSVYGPALRSITKDQSRIDNTIQEIVVEKLYVTRILQTQFNENDPRLAGKSLEKKVSAYLSMVFKKNVEAAWKFLKEELGPGSKGTMGRQPTDALSYSDSSGDEDEYEERGRTHIAPSADTEDEELSQDEVRQFAEAFLDWVEKNTRVSATVQVIKFITDRALGGETRKDIRDSLLHSGLTGRDGQPYTEHTYKKAIARWVETITAFAESDDNPFADTAISQMIVDQLAQLKSPEPVTASLHLAVEDTGVVPQAPYSSTTNQPIVVEPAPPKNPNVIQQENAAQAKNNPNTLQQGEQDFQQPQQQQEKLTIPPEIPGANHL